MSELFGSDAFAPREGAQRIESVGVTKARTPTAPLLLSGHADECRCGRRAGRSTGTDQAGAALIEAQLHVVICNVLVCTAVRMSKAGRSVVQQAVVIVLPVSTFVAAAFEHSIANMHLFPLAKLIQRGRSIPG